MPPVSCAIVLEQNAITVVGVAGGGMVKATFNGSGRMEKLEIDPKIASESNVVQELTVVAVNDAQAQLDEQTNEIMMSMGAKMSQHGGMADLMKDMFNPGGAKK